MTALTYVTKEQMEARTGFKTALGYAFPDTDEILIRKGLPKKLEKKVKQHEEDHILKGEEGPGLFSAIASVIGAKKQAKSADKATQAQVDASAEQIRFAEESRDLVRGDQEPYRDAGNTALQAIMSLTGLAAPRSLTSRVDEQSNVQGPIQNFQPTNYLEGLGGRALTGRFSSRSYGGNIYGRAGGGNLYNVNELGPESVYTEGSYTRSNMPSTLPPQNGYVAPNIQGRAFGGSLLSGNQVPPTRAAGYGGPGVTNGATIDNNTGAIDSGYVRPQENPGGVEGEYNFQTDPGYEFRFNEGQRALERGAAAAGGLLSGGFARRAMRYGQDYASNEYSNVYNRIANIAGLGQTANQGSAGATIQAGIQSGNAASNAGFARASGYTATGNAYANAANQIGQIDWGNIFNRSSSSVANPAGSSRQQV